MGVQSLPRSLIFLVFSVSNPFISSYMSLLTLLPLCGMLASLPMKISHPGGSSSQLCLALGNPMDCSPPGSSVHGALQARILEWVAIPFSRHPWLSRSPLRISVSSELTIWARQFKHTSDLMSVTLASVAGHPPSRLGRHWNLSCVLSGAERNRHAVNICCYHSGVVSTVCGLMTSC